MSEHAWVQEQIAAAVADGLTPEETERLDTHLRDCPECAAALDDSRTLDGKLGSLFAAVRPGPLLGDRVIQALRSAESRRRVLSGWRRKLAVGIAASVGIGLTGAAVDQLAGLSGSPFQRYSGLSPATEDESTTVAPPETERNAVAMAAALGDRLRGELSASAAASSSHVSDMGRGPWEAAPGSPAKQVPPSAPPGIRYEAKANDGTVTRQVPAVEQSGDSELILLDKTNSMSDSRATGSRMGGTTARMSGGRGSTATPPVASAAPEPASGLPPPRAYAQSEYAKPSDLKPAAPPGDAAPSEKKDAGGETKARSVAQYPGQLLEYPKRDLAERVSSSGEVPAAKPESGAPRKIVIRSGDIEFEVDSFDPAVATVTRLVTGIERAYVATVNSDKLPNGKVKGSMVLRVPPEHLDSLVLDLRKELGKADELKGLRIGSQDITKQYTDLESRLRAARTMEARLLQIIKEGKGEIKQLLEVEKELGVWRTRAEEFEGELRYFGNLAALSTLTVTLAEKEIRSAVATTEIERVQAGIEVEDVDKALQQAQAAVAEAKGRVTKSELKQLAAGQFNAVLHCELAPEAAGPFRDRLSQLGRVARLEIDRVQQSEGGSPGKGSKVTRGDTQFLVQFYNLANVAPREVATLTVALADVPAGYQSLREAVGKARGRVIASHLDEQDRQNVTAQLDFEVRRADESTLQTALAEAGEIVSRNVTRAADGDNLTDSKVLFRAALISATRVKPRETTALALEVPDVDAATAVFGAQVQQAKGRTVDVQAAHERGGRVTARLIYDVPLSQAPALIELFKAGGVVRVQQSSRDLQAPEGRFATARLEVTLSNVDLIVARDDGLWPQVRRGLSFSVTVLLMSVTWIVFGLCVLLPWALVGYGGYRLFRRVAPRFGTPPPSSEAPG
jgi:hypothetical protein